VAARAASFVADKGAVLVVAAGVAVAVVVRTWPVSAAGCR
jgi:hypothetical protein